MSTPYPWNPEHPQGTCTLCGEEMRYNVPRLGPNGGFVHVSTGETRCQAAHVALPCARKASLSFNVNEYVRVKLSEHGKECLRKNHEKLWASPTAGGRKPPEFKLPKEDADGWTRFQLHELISEFGEHVFLGCKMPFDTEIEIPLLEHTRITTHPA